MARQIVILLGLALLVAWCARGIPQASANDPNATDIITGLQQADAVLDSLAGHDVLGENVPLTEESISDALGLSNLFSSVLGAGLDDTDLAALESSLEARDISVGSVDVIVGCDGSCDGGEDPVDVTQTGDVIAVHVPINATVSVPIDMAFASDVVNLDGGALDIEFTASTTLDFELNPALEDIEGLPQAFAIVGEPTIEFRASTETGTLTTFTANLGFTEVSVSGDVDLSFGADIKFEDPENAPSDPTITLDELMTTDLADLLTITLAPGSLTGTVTFDSSLISGTTDGTLTFDDITAPLGDGFTFDLDDVGLDKLRNMTARDAFRALQRLNSWMDGLQAGGVLDTQLPLVGGDYSDVLAIGEKLAVALQGAPETACAGGADDDGDGRVNDGCPAVGTPETGAQCTNSINDDGDGGGNINDGCPAAGGLLRIDDPLTPLSEEGEPDFDDAVELGQKLASKLGISAIVPTFDNAGAGSLEYTIAFGDGATKANIPVDFGGSLDILSGISITSGGNVGFQAGYDFGITFGLDLAAQPTEDGAGIGSCEDGLDNSAETGNPLPDDGQVDAADGDCAQTKTIEQRAFVDVGTTSGTPELTAGIKAKAQNVTAAARIAMLEAEISDADLTIASTGEEDGDGPGSCADGVDNGDGDGIDAEDPECASIEVDFYDDGGDGRLTLEEFFNVLADATPGGPTFEAEAHIDIDGTVAVAASLGSQNLGGGNIVLSGTLDGPLTSPSDLFDNFSVDASDLQTSDLFNFSPCGTGDDEDGDGKTNDGCPQVGPDPETGDDCNDSDDDDSDGSINDGCPALSDPESESVAMLDKIVALVRALADQLDAMQEDDIGSSLSDPLPLIGKSFNDLLSYADAIEDLADQLESTAEEGGDCSGNADDDGDGYINDGCPTVSGVPEAGEQCAEGNNTSDEDNDATTSGIQPDAPATVNDGCPAIIPTLQRVETQLEKLLADALDAIGLDGETTNLVHSAPGTARSAGVQGLDVSITLDTAGGENDLLFKADVDVSLEHASTLNTDLSDIPGLGDLDLVALGASGDVTAEVAAALDLDFGLDLDDYSVFVLGSTGMQIDASLEAKDFVIDAALGPLTVSIGTNTAVAETACGADTADNDKDGRVNDGCPTDSVPESGGQCGNDQDDDGDGAQDDGCGGDGDPGATGAPEVVCDEVPAVDNDGDGQFNDGCESWADKGRLYLGAQFDVAEQHGDTERVALADLNFSGAGTAFDGPDTQPAQCNNIGSPGAHDACAVLPLYFEGQPIGDAATGAHHIEIGIADITDLSTLSATFPDPSLITDLLAQQLIDLALLHSGLGEFFDKLRALLDGEIFGFEMPLVGDQLDEAIAFVDKIEQNLIAQFATDPLSAGGPLVNTSDVTSLLDPFRDDVGTVLNDAGILGDTNGDSAITPTGANSDFQYAFFCDGDPCIAPESGPECANAIDDDGDDKVNDGCAQVGDFAESGAECDDNADSDAGAETGGSLAAPDNVVNDGCYPGGFDPPAADITEIRFNVRLGQEAATGLNADFNIGIPGLGLRSRGADEAQIEANWQIDLGFGVNKDEGFFLLTHEPEGPAETGANCSDNYIDNDNDGVPNDGCDELTVGAEVTLGGAELEGELGFLLVRVKDGDPAQGCSFAVTNTDSPCLPAGDAADPQSVFRPQFTIDLMDPGASPDGKLTFTDVANMASFSDLIEFDLTADADVNLHIETSIAGEAALPKLIADFKLDWHWSLNGENDTDALEDPNAEDTCNDVVADGVINADDTGQNCLALMMDDVVLDAGTFISKFLAPVFGDIQEYTRPLQPVIDVLEECIPVISDLSGSCTSLLTLIETFGPSDPRLQLIITVVKIVSFVNSIPTSPSGTGDLTIPIGDGTFGLNGALLQGGSLPASSARNAFTDSIDGLASLLSGVDDKFGPAATQGDVTSVTATKSIGFSFPVWDDPGQLLTLMFGQDVVLVQLDAEAEASFSYSQKFGPIWALPPVFLEVGGSASLKGRLTVGYDTQGLREVLLEGAGAASLLNGLFLGDTNAQGIDDCELELKGELFAGANVSVLIFSAGARGGIFLNICLDLQDPDGNGRLKFQEVANILEATGNPFCIFIFSGEFGLFVKVFAEVDLFFWSQTWEKLLAELTLLSFNVQCDLNVEPVLAGEVDNTGGLPAASGTGVLLLHVGPHSDRRGPGSIGINTTAEEFTVRQVDDHTLTVTAFGITQTFVTSATNGWALVIGDAGDSVGDPKDDEDEIHLLDGVVGAESTCLNAIDDDDPPDGFVNDGCPKVGDDKESGAECENNIDDDGASDDGETESVVNDGCPTVGEVIPFTVPSNLWGGAGNDKFTGSLAYDFIDGGDGEDVIQAREGDNDIIGGGGNDTIDTGTGVDFILGDTGSISRPNISTNASPVGDDSIDAGLGADTVHGGPGDDNVIGGISTSGAAAVGPAESGLHCADQLDNDSDGQVNDGCVDGNDTLHGGSGLDTMNGGDGNDTINGNDGADNINGAKGNDTINGGNENSPDQAGASPEAGAQCDNGVNDDPGDDSVADDGCPGDVIMGGPGSDTLDGQGGDDKVIGGNLLPGEPDEGDASVAGGADDDQLFGDNVEFVDNGSGGVTFKLVDPNIGGLDKMFGGDGNDVMRGQTGDDQMLGGNDDDNMDGNAGQDIMLGDDGLINALTLVVTVSEDGSDGADTMHGSEANDRMYGGGDGDNMFGDGGEDYMEGNGGDDTMRGGQQADEMYGNADEDTMFGDSADDYMEGNGGSDTMRGGIGQDDMIGGSSSAGQEDEETLVGLSLRGDDMFGDANQDVMIGDNGTIIRPGGSSTADGTVNRTVTVLDLACDDDNEAGNDFMFGNSGNDDMYGGGENDVIHGNAGDDYIEGNCGDDDVYGDADQDDLIGGTSNESNGAPAGGGVPDGDDDMWGGSNATDIFPTPQYDVMAGDNASITRPTSGGDWITDDFSPPAVEGVVRRNIALYDVATSGGPAVSATLNGDDEMFGESDYDIMYGQGGDDTMHGNGGDDHLEGNAGDDTQYGDAGQDDLIGGTGRTISNDPASAANGRLDEQDGGDNDVQHGGDGADGVASNDYDTIVGDNATVDRPVQESGPDAGEWTINTFNAAVTRTIVFYDVGMIAPSGGAAAGGTNGNDTQRGERDDDTMYGQGGADDMQGNAGDDYMEGNDGADDMQGNEGNDDMAGGTGRIAQFDTVAGAVVQDPAGPAAGRDNRRDAGEVSMSGGPGFDFMIGDNGVITRVLDGDGAWVPSTNHAGGASNNGVQHNPVVLRDVQLLGGPSFAGASGGEQDMTGDEQDDVMYGQGGDDQMFGNTGDDYMEGNHANDSMEGNEGQDDMLGGGSDDSNTADAEESALDLLDGDDDMSGESGTGDGAANGDGPDVMIGDNGLIDRCPAALDCEWQQNSFNDAVFRVVTIFDVETLVSAVDLSLSGDDDMYGNDNDDVMYGQGGEDDMFGGSGDDYMEGNAHSDVMLGGPQQDDMLGGTGRTTSNDPATLLPGRTDASTNDRNVPLGANPALNVALGDTMVGDTGLGGETNAGDGADVMLGDNGEITRPTSGGEWIGQAYKLQADEVGDMENRHDSTGDKIVRRVDRNVVNIDAVPGATAGSDLMLGNGGDDDMYGQFDDANPVVPQPDLPNPVDPNNAIGDEMHGNEGEDAMSGDQGVFDNRVLPPPPQEHIEPNEPFIDDDIYTTDVLFREFTLNQIPLGGNDRMRGGLGADWMHGGAGHDLMNGDDGNDRLFGDNGADDMWGGRHHDHLWGGYDYDQMDLHPNVVIGEDGLEQVPCVPNATPDPQEWYFFGVDGDCDGNFEDVDYMYGGWDADAMQANIGDNGPRLGDRLLDWVGVYNLYVLCPGTYGEFVTTREFSPAMTDFLFDLVPGDGAVDAATSGSSGFNEIAFVYRPDLKFNQQPPYVDTPAHFNCDNVEPLPTATATGTATDTATPAPTDTPGGPTQTPTPTPVPTDTATPTNTATPNVPPGQGKKTPTATPTP